MQATTTFFGSQLSSESNYLTHRILLTLNIQEPIKLIITAYTKSQSHRRNLWCFLCHCLIDADYLFALEDGGKNMENLSN